MKLDIKMAEKGGGVTSDIQLPSTTLPKLTVEPPQNAGWMGFFGRRGSNIDMSSLNVPQRMNERKTSLTPEMDGAVNFSIKETTSEMGPIGKPVRRGSLFEGLLGTSRRGSFMEDEVDGMGIIETDSVQEQDFSPPTNLPRRTSMGDAFQWLFKPMNNNQPSVKTRDINVLSPTST